MERTNEMLKLGEAFVNEGIKRLKEYKIERPNFIYDRHKMIIKKRFAVVEFINGLELILKAIMIRKGYNIYLLKRKLFKKNEKMSNMVNPKRTIDLLDVIEFFRKNYRDLPFNGVDELREIRNQIVHKGTEIGTKKREYFIDSINCIIGIYNQEDIKHRKFLRKIEESKDLI